MLISIVFQRVVWQYLSKFLKEHMFIIEDFFLEDSFIDILTWISKVIC